MSLKGHILQCHTDLIMVPSCISDNVYKIVIDNDDELAIKNDQDVMHYFSKDPKDDTYYGNWFNLNTIENKNNDLVDK